MLGWWWLVEIIVWISICWLPFYWLMAVFSIIGFTACFGAFIRMNRSGDHPIFVAHLVKTYKIFGLGVLTLGQAAGIGYAYGMLGIPAGLVVLEVILVIVIDGGFRFYILKVMERYHQARLLEGGGAPVVVVAGGAPAGVVVLQPGMQQQYAQPGMYQQQ